MHVPRRQTPCDEQSDGHERTPSSRPIGERVPKVARRFIAVPATRAWPPSGSVESDREQSSPWKPVAHRHIPPEQMPCSEQPFGHGAETEQSGPVKPGTQTHEPDRQTPRPAQS